MIIYKYFILNRYVLLFLKTTHFVYHLVFLIIKIDLILIHLTGVTIRHIVYKAYPTHINVLYLGLQFTRISYSIIGIKCTV